MARRVTLAGARVSAGYTQEALAEAMGVTRQTVNAWENGKTDMKPSYFIAFCTLTGFSKDDILLPFESTESKQEE